MSVRHAVIIGNGIAGITAARRLRELDADVRITVISGESDYHYSRPALMYIFMGHLRYADTKPFENSYWAEQRIDLVRDWVTSVDVDNRTLTLHRGEPVSYDALLLATGSRSNRFGWPGQDLEGVQGLYDLMDLHQLYANTERTKHAVVVGGGLIGIELAEMLHSRGIHVSFLVREASYWGNVLPAEESQMVSRLIEEEGFDLRLSTELAEIVDDGNGRVGAVVTNTGDRIDCELVGLTAGVSPNIDLAKDAGVPTGRGILVDWSLRSEVPGVFAAGDCAEIVTEGDGRNLLQQVWYTGKMQGRVAAEAMLGGDVQYDPGTWYNSAKFLDLEYQTYGMVQSRPQEGEQRAWWEHPSGKQGFRLVADADGAVTGINVMGIRYRHDVCERWIRERWPVARVLDDLSTANFDTEFFRRHEADIARAVREQIA